MQKDWLILLRFDSEYTTEQVTNYLDTVLDFDELEGYDIVI